MAIDTTSIAAKLTDTFGSKIADAAARLGSAALTHAKIKLEIGFRPYLEKSYTRTRWYKTLLNPYEPSDLETTYIHVGLSNPRGRATLTDEQLISHFLDGSGRFVVTGLAGCGKSMLMRYATLRTFESLRLLPIYYELRKVNGPKEQPLLQKIYEDCTPDSASITFEQFKLAMKSGLFALILDGFDEIEYDKRRGISADIKNLISDYPEAPVLLSSRPDSDVFTTWAEFQIYEVEKFDKRQTKELVALSKHDEGVKTRFLAALEERLFASHSDFLKSPLLTLIMLLTFEEFAEIPTKMHAFYSRAFDTLFQKHDADKEQFVRKTRTGLPREDFKLVLSCFCAISYLSERFSFSSDELRKFIIDGITYAQNVAPALGVNHDHFICDLRDAVCLIQEDGLNFVFVHRSFQEYFSAVFLDKIEEAKVERLANRFSNRFGDNVLPMALDMSQERLEVAWLVPTLARYLKFFADRQGSNGTAKVVGELLGSMHVYLAQRSKDEADLGLYFMFPKIARENLGPLEVICTVEQARLGPAYLIRSLEGLQVADAREKLLSQSNSKKKAYKAWSRVLDGDPRSSKSHTFKITAGDDWWLRELGFAETCETIYRVFSELKREAEARISARASLLDDLLSRT